LYQNGPQLLQLYAQDGTLLYTPLMLLDQSRQFRNRIDEFKLIANAQASYQLTKDLSIGTNFGLDYTHISTNAFESPTQFNALLFLGQGQEFGGFQDFGSSRNFGFNANTRLNYNKTFAEKHNVDVSLYTEYYKAHFLSMNFRQNGLNPKQAAPGAGTGFVPFNLQHLTSTDQLLGLLKLMLVYSLTSVKRIMTMMQSMVLELLFVVMLLTVSRLQIVGVLSGQFLVVGIYTKKRLWMGLFSMC
jgi:hypothetical protein